VHYDHDFRRQGLVRLARRYVLGPRVLDMRCITGALAIDLAARGMDVTALDGYEGAVATTNARAKRAGLRKPLAQLWDLTGLKRRMGAKRFETVVCLDVLNHVRDDAETVAEISQVMAARGRLIVAAPAFPTLLGRRDKSLGHLRRYTRTELRLLLECHGLVVDRMRYWNATAFPVYALMERAFKQRISDNTRYGVWGKMGSLPNQFLTWWYTAVENHVSPPFGLTHFVIARKK
jgi:SAM-dependent methyltransferase